MLKKILIADPIGLHVDQAYANSALLTTPEAALAIVAFGIQIYCDFSAYTDMAIALALMFGIKFPENFKSPYKQTSITATWACWHMTLTHWLRDYVLIPLYAQTKHINRYLAVIVTMLVSGLWHGANWTFVLWGLSHGLIIWFESITGYSNFTARQKNIVKMLFIGLNFIIWSLLSVMFRADTMQTAFEIWVGLFRLPSTWHIPDLRIALLCVIVLALHKYDQANWILKKSTTFNKYMLVPVTLVIIIGSSMLFYGRPQSFYYFDF